MGNPVVDFRANEQPLSIFGLTPEQARFIFLLGK